MNQGRVCSRKKTEAEEADGEKIENVVKFQRNMWDLLKIDVKYK